MNYGSARFKLLMLVVGVLSYVIPKRKQKVLFLPSLFKRDPMRGNIASVFKKCAEDKRINIEVLTLAEYAGPIDVGNYHNVRVVSKAGALDLIRSLLQAELIVLDAFVFLPGRYQLIQLWHGTGYKNIQCSKAGLNRFKRFAYEWVGRSYRYICASSEVDAERKRKAFRSNSVVVSGSPRMDIFFSEERDALAEKARQQLGLSSFDEVILYAPTFRLAASNYGLDEDTLKLINSVCESRNAALAIKMHPNARWNPDLSRMANIIDITKAPADVQEVLLCSDCLVSDYSGIISDVAIQGKPIILYWHDLEEYMRTERDFYYELEKLLPGKIVRDSKGLISALRDRGWLEEPAYWARYTAFAQTLLTHEDGQASERVAAFIASEVVA